jgi:hypothetical protein
VNRSRSADGHLQALPLREVRILSVNHGRVGHALSAQKLFAEGQALLLTLDYEEGEDGS